MTKNAAGDSNEKKPDEEAGIARGIDFGEIAMRGDLCYPQQQKLPPSIEIDDEKLWLTNDDDWKNDGAGLDIPSDPEEAEAWLRDVMEGLQKSEARYQFFVRAIYGLLVGSMFALLAWLMV